MMTEKLFAPDLFKDKTVIVTGAGRGIGLAVTQAFAQAGARLIVHSGRHGTATQFENSDIDAIEADFSKRDDTQAFVEAVLEKTNTVDVLVNNAGTMLGRFPAENLTDAQYDELIMLNQTSVVAITRGLIEALGNAKSSAIVNTVSISAKTGGSPGSAIYSATKSFVATYTKALARELAPKGIRANAVSPGTITTDFHSRYSTPEKLENTRTTVPLGRLGSPEDCAPAYLFMASDRLSGYITGQVLEINGGQLIA